MPGLIFTGESTELPVSEKWAPLRTIHDIVGGGPTPEGWHASVAPWKCPEKFRLVRLGVKRASAGPFDYEGRLTNLAFGSSWHRIMQADLLGKDPIKAVLAADGIPGEDLDRLQTLYLAYKLRYPKRGFTAVGVEAKLRVPVPMKPVRLITDVRSGAAKLVGPYFSCRLDVLALLNKHLINMERKTTSRYSPTTTMQEWRLDGQIISQAWACSRHPWVQSRGGLYATYMDLAIKTNEPDFHREPLTVARSQVEAFERSLIGWYELRAHLEQTRGYQKEWPRTWDCAGRYQICEYSDLCHFGAEGLYTGLQ